MATRFSYTVGGVHNVVLIVQWLVWEVISLSLPTGNARISHEPCSVGAQRQLKISGWYCEKETGRESERALFGRQFIFGGRQWFFDCRLCGPEIQVQHQRNQWGRGPGEGAPPDGQGSIVWEGALSVKGAGSRYVAEVGGSDLHLKTPDFSTFIIQTLTPPWNTLATVQVFGRTQWIKND